MSGAKAARTDGRREGSLIEMRRRDVGTHHPSAGIRHGDRNPEWDDLVRKSEQEVIGWFRSWHAQLGASLEREFGKTEPTLDAAKLTAELPRQQQDYRAQLAKAKELPHQAFKDGTALDMLCYLALQALPRHSRIYSNVHMAGKWHDMIELKAVHGAMLEHDSGGKTVEARDDPRLHQRRRSMNMTSALEASDVRIDVDSASEDEAPEAHADEVQQQEAETVAAAETQAVVAADGAPKPAPKEQTLLQRLFALEPVANFLPQLAQRYGAVEPEPEPGPLGAWYYVDDVGFEQGPFTTQRMRKWLRKGYITTSRIVRPHYVSPSEGKPLGQWPELDSIADPGGCLNVDTSPGNRLAR